ncbi:MAG: CHC2 zinc finger domain-containing protein [Bacteroidota bacterium]
MTISEDTVKRIKDKMVIEEVVQDLITLSKKGINLIGLCPFHSEKTPSFYVSPSKQICKCFGCSKGGDAIFFLMEGQKMSYPEALKHLANKYNIPLEEESKVFVLPEWRNKTDLSEKIVKWFESRKISQKTLLRAKVTEGVHFMPQLEKEVNTVQFNYFRDDVLTNVKYRDNQKNFALHPKSELIYYNIDSVKGKKEVFIVEGEMDALSLIEAGYDNETRGVVSVPNGASVKNNNTAYVDNSISLFEKIKTIYIAVDNDIVGRKLRDELADRYGKDRCKFIEWKDKKDANDVLKEYGIQGVIDCCSSAQNFPVEGIYTVSDFGYEIDDMYVNGLDRGVSTKLWDFPLRFVLGYMTVITGIPGMGKSAFVDEITLRLLIHNGWKGAYYSPENRPTQLHFSKLARHLTGKHWDGDNKMTPEDYKQVKDFLDKKVFFILPEKDFTLKSICDKALEAKLKYGIKWFVIDAWSKLEHLGGNDPAYIGRELNYLSEFCKANQLHCIMVAHPTKIEKDKRTDEYPVPTLYNISGGAMFYNMFDNGLSIYVNWKTGEVEVHRQKIKFDHWGWKGMSKYKFDETSLRYYNELHPETKNWITGLEIVKPPPPPTIQEKLFETNEIISEPGPSEDEPF